MTAVVIGIGTLAMVGAMIGFALVVTSRPSSDRSLVAWMTIGLTILALVFLVMGGHMWGNNDAEKNTQRAATAVERR